MKQLIILLLLTSSVFAQKKNPDRILNTVKDKFNKVQDYVVDVSIIADVDFIEVPEMKATLYFKSPDKTRLKSKGFAFLPKEGMTYSPAKLLGEDYTAIYIKTEDYNSKPHDVIKIIPNNNSLGVVLSTIWIETENYVISKVEVTTKERGTFSFALTYGKEIGYALPAEAKFSFNVDTSKLPTIGDKRSKKDEPVKGTVTIKYINYIVNKGVDDNIFEEEEKSE